MPLTETEPKTIPLQQTPRRRGLRLWRVEVLNWGTLGENIVHGTDIAGGWLCVTGRNGAGKSTLADAIITAFPPAHARIHYNAAGGARNTKERTRETYLRGYFGSEQDGSGRAKPSALRTKAGTLTAILLQFHEEGTTRWVTALVLGTFDSRGDHWLYGILDRKESLEVVKGTEDWDARAKRLRKLGWQIGAEPAPYRDRLRDLLRIPSEKAITTFVRTVGMKDIGDVNNFIRMNMLDDVSVHDRYVELTKHYQKQIEIDHEIETTRKMIDALRPLSRYVPSLRQLDKELESEKAITAAVEWRVRQDSASVLSAILADLQAKVAGATNDIVASDAEKARLETQIATLKTSQPALRIKALSDRAASLADRRVEVSQAAEQLRAALRTIGKIPFPASSHEFVEMTAQLKQIVDGADASEESRISAVFEAAEGLKTLQGKLVLIDEAITGAKESGSHLPPRDLAARARVAQAMGLKNSDLPYVGELIDVAPSHAEWRVALEKLLRTYARRMLVPQGHASRVLAFVNATKFERHRFRLEVVPARVTRFTIGGNDPKLACAKLRIKPNTPFGDWLSNALGSTFDHACFKDVADYDRHRGRAVTLDGLVKGGGEYHEKRDDIEIESALDYFLGWDNEEKMQALRQERTRLTAAIAQADAAVIAARNAHGTQKSRRDAAKGVLDSLKTFQSVDLGAVNKDLAALEKDRALLAQFDPEAAETEKAIADAAGLLATAVARSNDLVEQRGGFSTRIEQLQEEIQEIEDWEEENPPPRAEDLENAVRFIKTPAPKEARLIPKWNRDCEREVQNHFNALRKQRSDVALDIKGIMSSYLSSFPTERKTLDDKVESSDAFLERLRELEEEKLYELQERFREHLKDNLALHVTQLKTTLQGEVGKSKRRIEEINKILATIPWEARRVIKILPRQNPDPLITELEGHMNRASAPLLAPTEAEKHNAFGAVKDLIKFLEPETTRKLVLDARNWTLFAVEWIDLSIEDKDRQRVDYKEDTDGLSGGQKNKLSVTLLASALAFQYDIAGANARPGTFRTVLIDEAFAKLDSENARYALELFKQFDFQLILVHPLDGTVRVAEDYVQGFLLATIRDGKFSNLTSVSIDDFRRLVDDAAQEAAASGS